MYRPGGGHEFDDATSNGSKFVVVNRFGGNDDAQSMGSYMMLGRTDGKRENKGIFGNDDSDDKGSATEFQQNHADLGDDFGSDGQGSMKDESVHDMTNL